ncbi:hypoxanthine phosphoribosyltransferase [Tissierella sp. MSJ-40]|uniref:Hypoxanthine phosphoribosyltransferase n=1 Tax=Tissierella simiarum TaxID=2841534 RepID=A0ABS6EA34_9FIRM|nr:hypoxanthine phosphoribosyltransferase [Tissierella simiarum]
MKGENRVESNKSERTLFSIEDINSRVKELGGLISKDYKDNNLVVVSLLRGSFIFTADLVRKMTIPVEIDFMTTSSYGHDEISTGNVNIIHDIRSDIKDKDVLIVDDIMDSGYTMKRVVEYLKSKKPNSIKICVMLDKPSRRKVDLSPDYVGFTIPDVFIVGYGLNYGDYYRNIPHIFTFD